MSLSNDTMEGKWLREILIKKLQTENLRPTDFQAVLEQFDIFLEVFDGLGLCLSEEADLLSQWRGYAEDGAGVSIGFSKSFLLDDFASSTVLPECSLHEVTYDEVGDHSKLDDVVEFLVSASKKGIWDKPVRYKSSNPTGISNHMWSLIDKAHDITQMIGPALATLKMADLLSEIFTIKNPAFREEQEWRLLSNLVYQDSDDANDVDDNCSYRAGQNGIVPYRAYTLPFGEKIVLEQVVLGPKNTSRLKDVEKFLRLAGLKDVEVKRSEATYR